MLEILLFMFGYLSIYNWTFSVYMKNDKVIRL